MSVQPYIAIEGAIGVGKTTLARILGEALSAQILLEVFEENPFLSSFYADRARYAFQTQVFFLLSRYRQQHRVIAEAIRKAPLVSDYLFAKDWLFAHLNLGGDELAMYERVYGILGVQIPEPTLVVFLRATTDTLMQRISFRDRPYERQMQADYINSVRTTYERFFAEYTAAPVLVLDTDHLDIVREPEARAHMVSQVKTALQASSYQPMLPEMDAEVMIPQPAAGRRLPDIQRVQHALDHERGALADLFYNYLRLAGQAGQIGQTLTSVWEMKDQLLAVVGNDEEARDRAMEASRAGLQENLADALVCLLRIANDAGIDLEGAYL